MNSITTIKVDIPTDVKEEATLLFNSLGLNMNTAINIFLKQAIFERGIPFEVKQHPSKEFVNSLKELDSMEKHKVYHDVDKTFDDILNDIKF